MTTEAARCYVAGALSAAELIDFERGLTNRPADLSTIGETVEPARIEASRRLVFAEIDTPAPARLERLVGRLRIGETTARLVAATPAFRRSFLIATVATVLFTTATANSNDGVNRLLVFLTLAPALPLLGTALAFGPASDPMHEVTVSTPMDGFRLVVIRTFAVYLASLATLVPGSLLIAGIGPWRWAWLLPGLALTACTLALSTRVASNVAAGSVAISWLAVVTVVAVSRNDDVALFRLGGQLVFLVIALVGAAVTIHSRHRFEEIGPT